MNAETAVSGILQRAVELDKKLRYTEALICYQEGLQMLICMMKNETGSKKEYLREKVEEYINRAEVLKLKIQELKETGKYTEQINIEDNSKGYGYENVFGRFLDEKVTDVQIEDPYIRTYHQYQNFIRFLELLLLKCKNLKEVKLMTVKVEGNLDQLNFFEQMKTEMSNFDKVLKIEYSQMLHDRQIILSSGWIIKIGRGLDYFKPTATKLSIGAFDLNLRNCHKTTVNIFHKNSIKQS